VAKKKKRKEEKKEEKGYIIDLKGIGFLLVAVIGLCPFGIVADIIKGFAAFLVGAWWAILLIGIGIYGSYMIVKRERPDILNVKFIGIYVVLFAVLVFSHLSMVEHLQNNKLNIDSFKIVENGITVLRETVNNILSFINTNNNQLMNFSGDLGGGIAGAIFSSIFIGLLTMNGTKVVCLVLFICGIIMFTGLSIYDVVSKTKRGVSKVASSIHRTPKKKFYDQEESESEEETNHKVISSISEVQTNEQVVSNVSEEIVSANSKNYKFPPISILNKPKPLNEKDRKANMNIISLNAERLVSVLRDFGIEGKFINAAVGPAVTQYELEIKAGTKVSKILSLNREIALALAAKDVRIQAPIPGKSTIGVELPNQSISMVTVREIIESEPMLKDNRKSKLLVVLGKDIMGKAQLMDISKTPHLLVAGSTGSGKSVCINSILASILMRTKPDEVKLMLVDPKKVELSGYNGVPHLICPVVTNPKEANIKLQKIVQIMEERYNTFEQSGTKNITSYNEYIDKKNMGLSESEKISRMPYIVVIIDELADLMLVAAKEVEDSIMRITQMARAAGIHLIVATQRPSTDVITGVVKANIPSRIAFAVASGIDSRTILDLVGAEKLLGKGDMLFKPQGSNVPTRIQGTFISEQETKDIVDFVCAQQKASYDAMMMQSVDNVSDGSEAGMNAGGDYEEPLYNEIVEFVVSQGKASASLLQRRFRLGYNRAARCIDLLEERGIVGPATGGSKPREVLVKLEEDKEE